MVSDGAALAFGAAAYIRWEKKKGGFWTRLVMAKCRVAPKNVVSISCMELNRSVVGSRIKNFVLKDTNFKFGKVFHFVDSLMMLGYIQMESGHLKPYECVRFTEFQSSTELEDGSQTKFA